MIVAELNRWITIEVETTAKNTLGTPTETYVDYKSTWAGVSFLGGKTFTDQAGENVQSDAVFTLRWDENISYKNRIVYLGQIYKITHIEPIGRRDGIRLLTLNWSDE